MLPPRIDRAAVRSRIGEYKDAVPEEKRAAIYQDLIGFVPPRIDQNPNRAVMPNWRGAPR